MTLKIANILADKDTKELIKTEKEARSLKAWLTALNAPSSQLYKKEIRLREKLTFQRKGRKRIYSVYVIYVIKFEAIPVWMHTKYQYL